MEGFDAAERLHWKILHRHKDGVENDVDELVLVVDQAQRNQRAVEVLNQVLLPAMKEVGDKFGLGELILPFVLQSAEVMKKTVTHLETYLEKKEGTSKGKIILATVYGDVHDIGKNLVKTILSNNGYEVHGPRQAGPGRYDHPGGDRSECRRHRLERPSGEHQQADAPHCE